MSKMIQIRNVPETLHRTLKARAASAGMTLSDYLLVEIEEIAGKPRLQEWLAEVDRLEPVELDISPEQLIRQERDAAH